YTFSAPTSGANESLLIVGDRITASSLGSTITGTSTTKFSGVIYLPKEALTFTGGSNLTDYTSIICDTLKLTGLTYIGSNYSALSGGNPTAGGRSVSFIQ
ncbi:MAG TPA: hypothetical protein VGH38_27850, partial [Bryobacteraceae bacterium]